MIYKLVTDKLLKCLQDIVGAIKCSLGKPNGIATLDNTGNVPVSQLGNAGGGGAGVASFNTRSGVVVPATNDYTFAQIGSKPTTLAGYGITDPIVLTSGSYSNPTWITSLAWSKITGTPTTLAGYSITDGVSLTGVQTLTNKTLTTPIISSISNTGILTLPTSTDTLVGRATTDTFTNKSISGSTNTFSNIPESAVTNLVSDLAAKQATVTLTTTGTTGASTFASNTLNIPQYQGALTLTTTGTSGAATLVSNTLNIPQYSGGGGGTATLQYMWVVGGANNFASLPGAPTPPVNGATTLTDSGLGSLQVRVYRNGIRQLGLNPADGDTYYTKSTNTVTFSTAIATGEKIIVETIPQ